MNLSGPFIRRPVMTSLVMFTLLIAGLLSFFKLPVSDLPNVDYPTIEVHVVFPGASPETMANNVASPLEKEFMTIQGLSSVTSSNTLGGSNIILQFDVKKSMDSAAQDVQAAISRARTKLPPELPNEPTYKKVNPSDTPILYLALTSETMRPSDLYNYANVFIGQRLSMLDGVAQVQTYGSPYAVRIQMDPGKLANLGITLDDVSKAIQSANPFLPTGDLNGRFEAHTIITKGKLENAASFEPIIVTYKDNAPVRLKDLGQAIDGLQNDRLKLSYVDKDHNYPAVVLAVQRQPGSNTVKVADSINQFLPKLIEELPKSVSLKVVFDKSQTIKSSIHEVEFTLILAFILVILVIYVYLGKLTETLIPAIVMPLSVLGTFIFMYLLGFSIDNLSLLALILAIGFIIDDAIVVIENIVRHVEEGETPYVAAIKGSKQIGFTILSMTLSLAAVFIPMLFMGGILGKIFHEFAITLLVITLLSGFLSLSLTPMLCRYFIPKKGIKSGFLARCSNVFNDWLISGYKLGLRGILRARLLAVLLALGSIAGSVYLFMILPKDFIPDDDMGFIMAFTQSAEGTSPEHMNNYQQKVMQILRHDPNVENFVSLSSFPQYRQGILFIRLKPREMRQSIPQVIQGFYMKTGGIVGLNTFFKNVPLIDLSTGVQNRGAYQYTLQSLDADKLYPAANVFIQKMKEIPGFIGVNSDLEIHTPQLYFNVLRDRASSLGITASDVEKSLLLSYAGGQVSRIKTALDQYDVILELLPKFQHSAKTLGNIYVRSNTNKQLIPLNVLSTWEEGIGPSSINHDSQFPSVTVSFSLLPGIPLSVAIDDLKKLAQETLPAGVTGSVKGAAETFQESISGTGFLLLAAILAIYVVLGILYESLIHPITILSTLAPATLGGLLTLYYFGLPLSMYAYLGIILLIGIVKKNGIMMVDFALENIRTKGESPEKSIYDACIVRFRPIMMTTLTAIMGALPIAIGIGTGADGRRPLGYVIIGGLIFSQIITLFVTPVIYLYMEKLSEKFRSSSDLSSKHEINV